MPRLYGDVISNAHPTKLLSAWLNTIERCKDTYAIKIGTPAGELLLELAPNDLHNIKDAITVLQSFPRITHIDLPTSARIAPPEENLPLDFPEA